MKPRGMNTFLRDQPEARHDFHACGDAFASLDAAQMPVFRRREHGRDNDRSRMDRAAFECRVEVFPVRGRAVDHCRAGHLARVRAAEYRAWTWRRPGASQGSDIVRLSCGDAEAERIDQCMRAGTLHGSRNSSGIERLEPLGDDPCGRQLFGITHLRFTVGGV